MQYILACDLGTGGNKASIYDARGVGICSAFTPYRTLYPAAGFHEQRPLDWWQAFSISIRELTTIGGVRGGDIVGMAISGQSLGAVPIDSGYRLLRSKTPIWSDTRAQAQASEFFSVVDEDEWYAVTGNGFSRECYTIFKAMWYRDQEPEMFSKIHKILGTKDYINMKLTGRIATDRSYASGSGVYNLLERSYESKFIQASGIPGHLLPEILSPSELLGELSSEAADELGLPGTVQVYCGGVDNSCMSLGAGNVRTGKAYISLGSSAWIAVTSQKPIVDAKIRPFVFDHVIDDAYTSAFGVFSAGTSLKWLRDTVCADISSRAADEGRDVYDLMVEEAQQSVPGSNDLLFNPSLAGGSGAHPSPHVRGGYLGLDLSHKRSDLIHAALEGIALELKLMFGKIEGLCKLEQDVLLVGGGGKSNYWRKLIANVLGRSIVRANIGQDAGCLGAAAIAAVGAGIWGGYGEVEGAIIHESVASPALQESALYNQIIKRYEYATRYLSELGDMVVIANSRAES